MFATGRLLTRGKGSGAEIESPYFTVVDMKNGKALRFSTYLDLDEALEARRAVGVDRAFGTVSFAICSPSSDTETAGNNRT